MLLLSSLLLDPEPLPLALPCFRPVKASSTTGLFVLLTPNFYCPIEDVVFSNSFLIHQDLAHRLR